MKLRSIKIKRGESYSERLSTSLVIFDSSVRQKNNNLNLSLGFTDSGSERKTLKAITETEEVSEKTTKEIAEPASQPAVEIDELDEEFDPTEFILDHQRPIRSLLPDVALPHSVLQDQWVWTRSVAMWRFPKMITV